MFLQKAGKIFLACKMLILIPAILMLGGCASDSVDVSLPFVGNVLKKTKRQEVALERRAPLVLPPKSAVGKLPPPVDTKAASSQAWPNDPDLARKKLAAAKAAKEKYYREHGNLKNYSSVEEFEKNMDWSSRQKGVLSGMLE